MKRSGLPLFVFFVGFLFGSSNAADQTKHILLYTNQTHSGNWHIHGDLAGEEYFVNLGCQVTNCVITRNKTYLANLKDYDVIAMSACNVPTLDSLPPPESRRSDQIYLLNIRESPVRTLHDFRQFVGLFNWTMAYSLKSDAPAPYGQFVDKETNAIVSPALKPAWKTPNYESGTVKNLQVKTIVEGKTKMASWFVSNCRTPSQRSYLAKKLQEFIQVDVYGNCGTFQCPKSEEHCRQMMESDYKFYLSFENSLCTDYVTEKVFQTMRRYIIPVVYGGVDYSRFLPPGSYINAQDYDSAEDLAEYMKYLSNNTEEYMKYFWWKDYYKIHGTNWCSVCEKLALTGEGPVVSQSYLDLESWFKNGTCYEPETVPIVRKALEDYKDEDIKVL